jgi:hypothetical protein
MALRMKWNAVFGAVRTTHHTGNAVVKAPAGDPRDFCIAHSAEPALFMPEKFAYANFDKSRDRLERRSDAAYVRFEDSKLTKRGLQVNSELAGDSSQDTSRGAGSRGSGSPPLSAQVGKKQSSGC